MKAYRIYKYIRLINEANEQIEFTISTENEKRRYSNATKLCKKIEKCENFKEANELLINSGLVEKVEILD